MTTIERGLARHVGPIAAYLIRSAVSESETVDALYDRLVASIEDPAGRDQFRRELRVQLVASLTRPAHPPGVRRCRCRTPN